MKILARVAVAACLVASFPMTAAADPQTYDTLKTLVAGLGYAPKDIGSETPKMEIAVTTDAFNVPVGLEISKSGRYIWITANLGASTLNGDRALQLLKRGGTVQPTQFWITSTDKLMVGVAVNNTEVTADTLKFVIDKLGGDVGKTADLWQAPVAAAPAPQ